MHKRISLEGWQTPLSPYCHFADENSEMTVLEWENGEGFDVSIERKAQTFRFDLTHGEFTAMLVLVNLPDKDGSGQIEP